MNEENFGDHEGRLIINHENIKYTIPFLLHYTPGSVFVNQQDQKLFFEISHPEEWDFAKISVINSKNTRNIETDRLNLPRPRPTPKPKTNPKLNILEDIDPYKLYGYDKKVRIDIQDLKAKYKVVF